MYAKRHHCSNALSIMQIEVKIFNLWSVLNEPCQLPERILYGLHPSNEEQSHSSLVPYGLQLSAARLQSAASDPESFVWRMYEV